MTHENLFGEPIQPAPTYQHAAPGETLRLFAPAPAPMPGQLDMAAALEEPAADAEAPAAPGRLTSREKRARKAERLRKWAGSRETKADAAYAGVKSITDRIPFGQPILVGHHSERGARADVRRIESGMDRFCEHNAKAADMRSRAENIERQAATAIYSDDEDATERLKAKIAKLEEQRDAMKRRNAEFKRTHAAELKAEPSAFLRNRMLPFPSYAITNIGAEIRRNTKRLEELSTPETGRWLEARYPGECRQCGADVARGDRVRYFKRARAVECETCATGNLAR